MIRTLTIGLLLCIANIVKTQNTFEGALTGGLNMAQIAGDYMAGYHQPGLYGGARVAAALSGRKSRVALELLYSQRGARSTRRESPIPLSIRLHYVEIPIVYQLNDWESTDKKHTWYKASAYTGLSVGQLFRSSVTPGTVEPVIEVQDKFTRRDLSFVAGLLFRPYYHVGFNARYTRSIIPLYDPKKHNLGTQGPQVRRLVGYYLSFGAMLYF